MSRSYVIIYQNKEANYSVYYDFSKQSFFSYTQKLNKSIIKFASFCSIPTYAIMKNVSFGMTIHPLTMLAIANMLGIILGFVSIKLINRVSDKELQRSKEVIHPTNQELRRYLFEGRKQSKRLILMICFLFFLVFSNVIFLYFMPQNILMFLLNIAILAGSILTVWAIRPIKRSQAHKLLEGKLESALIE